MKPAEKSRGGRPWTFDRTLAVDKAMRLFWKYGYEGVSIGDLTKEIGIAPPSLYAAFGSKADLFREAVDHYEKNWGALDFGSVQTAQTLSQVIRTLLEGAVRAVTDPDRERGCMISSGMVSCHPAHSVLADDAAGRRDALRASIVAAVARFATEQKAIRLGRYISAVLQGISIQARDGASRSELQEIVEEVVSSLETTADEDR